MKSTSQLDRERLAQLDRATIWTPQPGPQLQAFLSKADQVLYGGAAGGGKTALGIGLALTSHWRTLFIRREGVQLLPVIDEVAALLGSRDGYNGADHVWRLAGGRQIQFGGIPNAGDESKFQGNARDLLVLDEAALLLEAQARFLLGWVRSSDPRQRCRALLCSNPPTSAEGEWLVRWFRPWLDPSFSSPAKPGELRWVAMVDGAEQWVDGPAPFTHGGEIIRPVSRTFIPSRVTDNRYLRSSGYVTTLGMLPEPLRSQMLHGDFTVGRDDARMQVIPSSWVREAQARWAPRSRPETLLTSVGLDVARGGQDKTVVTLRYDTWVEQIAVPGRETPDGPSAAALVLQHHRDNAPIIVDVGGIGTAVYDALKPVLGFRVQAFNGSEKSFARDRSKQLTFANRRAEAYWTLREALDPVTGEGIALPPAPTLLADLTAATWKLTSRGVLIESKDDLIKRLGRSPDSGDSVVYAFARRRARTPLEHLEIMARR